MSPPECHSAALDLIDEYRFRDVIPSVYFGTASDRYAGWIGQIYSEEWRTGVSKRKRSLGGKKYEEQTVPVASVEDYFGHFDALEIDYTFYRPLLDADGGPTNNYFVLQRYADASPHNARFYLKAPQQVTARVLRRSRGPGGTDSSSGSGGTGGSGDSKPTYEKNPTFLDRQIFVDSFVTPASNILGSRLSGILFEQEYQRKSSSVTSEQNVADFDRFFKTLSGVPQIHIELRSPHLLTQPYFAWLADRGIGHVFSHWTWLPSIADQWRLSGKRFTSANAEVVCRLLTPRKMPYAKAYALAYPFNEPVPELSETPQANEMINETADLAIESLKQDRSPIIISNNRAWGNAPSLAQKVAGRILDELEGSESSAE